MDEASGGEVLRIASSGIGFDARERTRRQALVTLAVSAGLVVVLAGITMVTTPTWLCGLTFLPLLVAMYALLTLLINSADQRPALAPGAVAIEDGVLRIFDEAGKLLRRIPLDQVTQGFWEEPDQVHLALRWRETLVARVPDAASGDRLLKACGVTAAERVLRVPLASAMSRVPGGSLVAGLALVFVFIAVVFGGMLFAITLHDILVRPSLRQAMTFVVTCGVIAPFLAGGYGIVRALRRREATVGADGIVFRRVRRALFVPYGDVIGATRHPRGVRIERRSGAPIVLPTPGASGKPMSALAPVPGHLTQAEAEREVLFERIQQALAARGQGAHPDAGRLDRRGRSLAAWREDLRKVMSEQAGYREARLTAADLARVIEDAGAPAERRIAAAVALAGAEPEEARRRVRIAADACADDDLRRALESAAEGELDEARLPPNQARE